MINLNLMKKIKIVLKDWHYQCGDRCCDLYGTKLYLNDELLEHPDSTKEEPIDGSYIGDNVENALKAVLQKLGYEVEILRDFE